MKLIIVPSGGLANRMRAVASGVALAAATKREPIVVWHRDSGLNARFSDLFLTEGLPFALREISDFPYAFLYEKPRKKNLFVSMVTASLSPKKRVFQEKDSKKFNAELKRLAIDSRRDLVVHSGFIFHEIDRKLMNAIFHYTPAVENRIEAILKGKTPRAALQIRRTDNRQSISGSPLSAFEEAARRILKEDVDAKIFVATDDQPTKDTLLREFGDSIILNPAPASRNTLSGMIDAAAELYILSCCRHIYGSYWSSFSEIASLIGGVPLTVVKI